jgi:hypothetical protein
MKDGYPDMVRIAGCRIDVISAKHLERSCISDGVERAIGEFGFIGQRAEYVGAGPAGFGARIHNFLFHVSFRRFFRLSHCFGSFQLLGTLGTGG